MRSLAFSDPGARARLEAILHPLIREESSRRLAAAAGPYAVLVVPLLLETGFRAAKLDRLVVVDLDETLQVRRAAARSGLTDDEVRAIMATQWPRWRRLQAADDVLWNGGEPGELRAQCARLHERLLADRPTR
jgi:dephospho-CoA kinase